MKQLTYTVTVTWEEFEFWSGAVDTVEFLSRHNLMDQAWDWYCDLCDNNIGLEIPETDVNDYFWFETDYIAQALGYSSYESMYKELEEVIEDD